MLEPGKEWYEKIRGQWGDVFFNNTNPIVLELACGKWEYTVGLAQIFKDKNFIGVDIKGERMFVWSLEAREKKLSNVGFLRTIIHHLEKFFMENEVSDIWIIHPDPRPKKRDAKRRLTHTRFLTMYKHILVPGWTLRLKTDDRDLFDFSLAMIREHGREILDYTYDLDNSPLLADHHDIHTNYEQKWKAKGRSINYLICRNVK